MRDLPVGAPLYFIIHVGSVFPLLLHPMPAGLHLVMNGRCRNVYETATALGYLFWEYIYCPGQLSLASFRGR